MTKHLENPKLVRFMGLWTLALYGVGDMMGAGIYGLVGKAAGQMGNAIWLAFLTSMAAALLTGLSYASLGARHPRAAGAAYVIHRAFGNDFLSYVLGLSVMASGLTSMAAGSRVVAGYLQGFLGPIPLEFLVIAFFGALTFINFWGIKESILFNMLCTLIEMSGLLIVILVGVKYWGSVNYWEVPPQADGTPGSLNTVMILQGAVLTFYSFIGFEDMLNVTEEVKDPTYTFPRAVLIAVVLTTLLYLAISLTAVSVIPYAELAKSKQPLVDVVMKAAPWFPPKVFSLISIFAVTNTALLNYLMGSRLVYGMARQGLLPSFLGSIHPTRHTPHLSIFTLAAIVLVLALSGDISILAKATSVLLLIVFIAVHLSLITLKRRSTEPKGPFEVPYWVPILGMVVCLTMLCHAQWSEFQLAVILILGISGLYFALSPRKLTEESLATME